jgi:hypothetical protein
MTTIDNARRLRDDECPKIVVTPAEFDAFARECEWDERTIRDVHLGGEPQAWIRVGDRLLKIVGHKP